MILILYSLFGFQVIVIQRQCLSVDCRERLDEAKPERVTALNGQATALGWTAYGA